MKRNGMVQYAERADRDKCANCRDTAQECADALIVDRKPCCKRCDHWPRAIHPKDRPR